MDETTDYASEQRAENAWLTHAERPDPEAQADMRLHDAEFPYGYGVTRAEFVAQQAEADSFDQMVGDAGKVTFKVSAPTPKPHALRPTIVAKGYGFNQSYSARVQREPRADERDEYLDEETRREDRNPDLTGRDVVNYNAITPKQASFLASLIASKGNDLHRAIDIDTLTKWDASRLIDELVKMPAAPRVAVAVAPAKAEPLPAVPDGRYAVTGQQGQTAFYRVSHNYAGQLVLRVQSSDTLYPIHDFKAKVTVLNQIIAQGIRESLIRYGKELGRCGICGRTLTDEESRGLGIGPICIGKEGI